MPPFLKKLRRLLTVLLVAVLLVWGTTLLPWKKLLENEAKDRLHQQGLKRADLTLQDLSTTDVMLTNLTLEKEGQSLIVPTLHIKGAPDWNKKEWRGTWTLGPTHIKTKEAPIPAFDGEGTLNLSLFPPALKKIEGRLHTKDKTTKLSFSITPSPKNPQTYIATMRQGSMAWQKGLLSTQNVSIPIPLDPQKSLSMVLKIDKVSTKAVLEELTGGRATATGTISGRIPVTRTPAGTLLFNKGSLTSDGPGSLTVSPDIIPGDNATVTLVRDVLQDFRFTNLTLNLQSSKKGKLTIATKIEGHNPKVQQGRAVKMNVNLSGDVLSLVQQSLPWLTDPRKILERGKK